MALLRQALLNEDRWRLEYLRREIEARAEDQPTYAELLRDLARNYEQRLRNVRWRTDSLGLDRL
jgi:hypothetical protein